MWSEGNFLVARMTEHFLIWENYLKSISCNYHICLATKSVLHTIYHPWPACCIAFAVVAPEGQAKQVPGATPKLWALCPWLFLQSLHLWMFPAPSCFLLRTLFLGLPAASNEVSTLLMSQYLWDLEKCGSPCSSLPLADPSSFLLSKPPGLHQTMQCITLLVVKCKLPAIPSAYFEILAPGLLLYFSNTAPGTVLRSTYQFE